MKLLFLALILVVGCDRGMDRSDERIQREEEMGVDDLRETDSYDHSLPVQNEEEINEMDP